MRRSPDAYRLLANFTLREPCDMAFSPTNLARLFKHHQLVSYSVALFNLITNSAPCMLLMQPVTIIESKQRTSRRERATRTQSISGIHTTISGLLGGMSVVPCLPAPFHASSASRGLATECSHAAFVPCALHLLPRPSLRQDLSCEQKQEHHNVGSALPRPDPLAHDTDSLPREGQSSVRE